VPCKLQVFIGNDTNREEMRLTCSVTTGINFTSNSINSMNEEIWGQKCTQGHDAPISEVRTHGKEV
jgi:hypothetical protein